GQELGALPGGSNAIAYGREIARRTAPKAETRKRARNVGARPPRLAHAAGQGFLIDEEADGVEATVDPRYVAQRACQPRRQLARARAGHGAIDSGEQAALLLARH